MINETEHSNPEEQKPPIEPADQRTAINENRDPQTSEQDIQEEFLKEINPELEEIAKEIVQIANKQKELRNKRNDKKSIYRSKQDAFEKTLIETRERLGEGSAAADKLHYAADAHSIQDFFDQQIPNAQRMLGFFDRAAKKELNNLLEKKTNFLDIDTATAEIKTLQKELETLDERIADIATIYEKTLIRAIETTQQQGGPRELKHRVTETLQQAVIEAQPEEDARHTSYTTYSRKERPIIQKHIQATLQQVKQQAGEHKLHP
jgi:hypothetical protein